VLQTDRGTFISVNARKQRTSRCLGLDCDKQVKIGNCQAERASRKSVSLSTGPPYGAAPNLQRREQADGNCQHLIGAPVWI
jgi:hypothetical protein